jgi:hypothetical protein
MTRLAVQEQLNGLLAKWQQARQQRLLRIIPVIVIPDEGGCFNSVATREQAGSRFGANVLLCTFHASFSFSTTLRIFSED